MSGNIPQPEHIRRGMEMLRRQQEHQERGEQNMDRLRRWHKLAARVKSVGEFQQK